MLPRLYALASILILAACSLPADRNPTPTTLPAPTATPAAREHRIGIRVVQGTGEFFDRATGERFVPRGSNYIRLAQQAALGGGTQTYHAVFDPDKYSPAQVDAALQRMHADGYNVVRVFLSQNTVGTSDDGLSPAYMANVADFLRRAEAAGIFVMFTQDWLPGGKYGEILNRDCCEQFALMNVHFLSKAGVEANQTFFRDFIQELLGHNAPLDAVFSYELRNELYFDTDQVPLSLDSGNVVAGNGENYDMSRSKDKTRMVEDNLVYWIDQVRSTILEEDPSALVSVGFFQPQAPNATRVGDPRWAVTAPAIWKSQADFIDLHAYPGIELNLKQYVENFGIQGMQARPIVMGEFGASANGFDSTGQAARALMNWQVDSCQYGFDGWLLWDWDTAEDPEFYDATQGSGEIERALAPVERPDPCQPKSFDFFENNLALGRSVRVSRALSEDPAAAAIDGTTSTLWSSGASAPQWIEIDLGKPAIVDLIRLVVSQYPNGNTVHELWTGGSRDQLHKAYDFSGATADNQLLVYEPAIPMAGVRFIRIVTLQSPSWVAWKEVEIIGP